MQALLRWLQADGRLIAYGAWDGDTLAAQYSCFLRTLHLPNGDTQTVGMSVNMAVHPDYRGLGLVKQVSRPTYAALAKQGIRHGVGFSNAAGVQVDKHSKGYGYQVIGQMESWLGRLHYTKHHDLLHLTEHFPDDLTLKCDVPGRIYFQNNTTTLRYRFAQHPFRTYCYAVCQDGIAVYRPDRHDNCNGAAILAVCAENIPKFTQSLCATVANAGMHYIRILSSPNTPLLTALKRATSATQLTRVRAPYFLTVKGEGLADFSRWVCCGGDIL